MLSLCIKGTPNYPHQALPTQYISTNIQKVTHGKASLILNLLGDFFGSQLGKVILASRVKKNEILAGAAKRKQLIRSGIGEEIAIKNAAGSVSLDAFTIKSTMPSDKWIVVFNGMGDQSDNHIKALEQFGKDTNANICTFDYRGVGGSRGKAVSMQSLVHDGEMVIDYLKNGKNIDPKNIMLYGHSLGGGVAARVHADLNHAGPLISESSFKSFAAAVSMKKGKIFAFFVKLFNWDLDAAICFENMKGKAIVVNRRDPTVRYTEASLYKKLKKTAQPGNVINRVKIGTKHHRETFGKVQVKHGQKNINKKNETKDAKQAISSEFQQQMRVLKKKRLTHLLQHPHERVMDRVFKYTVDANIHNQAIQDLREKFHQEDLEAYKKINQLISELWADEL